MLGEGHAVLQSKEARGPGAGECRSPPGEEVLLLLLSDPSQAGVGVILPPVWPQTLRHKTGTLPLA